MRNLFNEQQDRIRRGKWDEFRQHQYDCYSEAAVGDIVEMPWGDKATLVHKETGIVEPDDYKDEDEVLDTVTFVFEDDDGIYHTQVYIGDYVVYDFPDISEYHHKSVLEIDPNDYKIGGQYITTYEYKKGEH